MINEAEVCGHCGLHMVEGCSGNGWITTPDGAAGVARRCTNEVNRRAVRAVAECSVPELYIPCTVDGFRSAGMRGEAQLSAARDACRSYVERFVSDGDQRTARGLLFVGPPGTGKTHLATAVLQAIARRHGVRSIFADFTSVCHEIQASYDHSGQTESAIIGRLLQARVLVLDELGARRPTPFVQDTLYLIINTRYSARLPTLFTSNHPLLDPAPAATARALDRLTGSGAAQEVTAFEPLSARVGPRIFSRLFEATEPALLFDAAADYRRPHG